MADEANPGEEAFPTTRSGGYADQGEVRQAIVRAPFLAPSLCSGGEKSDPE